MHDCIVIGGGIIGLLTARELKLAGMDVCVVERGKLGGESSWAGGGIISPLYPWRYSDAVNVLAEKSKQIYPELSTHLYDESGVDCEYIRSGVLITHDDELDAARGWSDKYGVSLQHVTGKAELAELSPGLNTDIESAIWMPDVHQIRNPKVVNALRVSCDALGIKYFEHSQVQQILTDKQSVKGISMAGQELAADKVVVAGGAWTAKLLRGIVELDVEPVKGQMVMLKTPASTVRTIVMSDGHYIIPRRDGHVLCGSTLEHTGFEKSVTDSSREQLMSYAIELIPQLGDYPVVRHWSGLRPGTQQGIPYICEHDQVSNLYIHAGHYRNGIVLGAASAKLMAEIVTGAETWCDVANYRINAQH